MARKRRTLGKILGPIARKFAIRSEQKAFDVGTSKLKTRRVAAPLISAGLGMSDPGKSKSRRAAQGRRFKEIRASIKQRRGF